MVFCCKDCLVWKRTSVAFCRFTERESNVYIFLKAGTELDGQYRAKK